MKARRQVRWLIASTYQRWWFIVSAQSVSDRLPTVPSVVWLWFRPHGLDIVLLAVCMCPLQLLAYAASSHIAGSKNSHSSVSYRHNNTRHCVIVIQWLYVEAMLFQFWVFQDLKRSRQRRWAMRNALDNCAVKTVTMIMIVFITRLASSWEDHWKHWRCTAIMCPSPTCLRICLLYVRDSIKPRRPK